MRCTTVGVTSATVTMKDQTQCIRSAHTMNLVCPVQNYDTYPIMPGALRALCPVRRGVTPGIRRLMPGVTLQRQDALHEPEAPARPPLRHPRPGDCHRAAPSRGSGPAAERRRRWKGRSESENGQNNIIVSLRNAPAVPFDSCKTSTIV